MYQFSNRECFEGRFLLSINQFNCQYYWPPRYIKCDCEELAEHQIRRNRGNFYPTYIWECPNCRSNFRLIRGTRDFERLS